MERLSSLLFMLSLLIYYIPKLLRIKKFNFRKAHIALGGMSVIAMCIALIQKVGNEDFIKYIGFTLIMLAIGITGYFFKENRKGVARKLHIISTIGFFVYLYVSVAILR